MPPAPKRRVRQPHQLPPGRHGLPRGQVEANQRTRILDAVADVVSLSGFAEMSVEDIIAAAGVSRRTFYDHFRSKEDAFLAEYDAIVEQLLDRVRRAALGADGFPARVRECLAALLQFIMEEPRYADVCIVEVFAAGPQAIERRNHVMTELAELIRAAAAELGPEHQLPELTVQTIVGGVYEVIYSRVLQGEAARVGELQRDLAYSILLPFLGPAAASHEAGTRE